MAATVEVVHPKLYLSVGGKLQHVPEGTPLDLSPKIAEGLIKSGKCRKIGDKKSIKIDPPKDDK